MRTTIIIFLLGCMSGAGVQYLIPNHELGSIATEVYPVREQFSEYSFINPLLFYEVPNSAVLEEYEPLTRHFEKVIADAKNKNPSIDVSVYYRDLTYGRWVGTNENHGYVPASLLKVTVMIAYFKKAETEPSVLSREIRFTPEIQSLIGTNPYDAPTQLELTKSYRADDLIERMIIKSDNGAVYTLLSQIDDEILDQVFSDLGLPGPTGNRWYRLSAQDYAFFFRILYNATYLSRAMSERALSLLSKTEFKEGLLSGLDRPLTVAHKYGESVSKDDRGLWVGLHDCGIIYYPEKPYFLCVMTEGNNLDDLKAVIGNISRAAYEAIK